MPKKATTMAIVFAPNEGLAEHAERRAVFTIYHDGSGSVAIYYRNKLRGSVSVGREQWAAVARAAEERCR